MINTKASDKMMKVLQPKMPNKLDNFDFTHKMLQDDLNLSAVTISDCIIENQIAEQVSFNQVIFRNVTFKQVSLKFLELTDVRFEICDLSNIDFNGAIIHRVEIVESKIVGINLSNATLRNVSFEQCDGKYAFFRFSNLKQVNFENCSLQNADFSSSTFAGVSFDYSNLQQSQLSGTKTKGIDFSNAQIDGLGIRIEDLDGAIVSPTQAVMLSKKMGIVIKE